MIHDVHLYPTKATTELRDSSLGLLQPSDMARLCGRGAASLDSGRIG